MLIKFINILKSLINEFVNALNQNKIENNSDKIYEYFNTSYREAVTYCTMFSLIKLDTPK